MAERRFGGLAAVLGVIWAVQVLNLVTGYALNSWFGLIPRALGGLDGIVLMPLLHGSVGHAVSNSLPLVILGAVMTMTARRDVIAASVIIVVVCGLGVWIFGRAALHVGASGLVFGWFAFLIARGMVEKRLVPVVTALGVGVVYGSLIWGVFPGQPGVSWEAHLFGAIGGGLAAIARRRSAGI
ncbi:MAG: rhomboid family intramembrane serine protease [Pseudomonadota bacterium]